MPEKQKPTLVLLDSHAIIHRAYHAIPDFTSPSGESVGAVYGVSAMLIKIINELKPDHIIAAYDLPGPTHRHEVYEAYKAKRPKMDDALVPQIQRSRDVLKAFGIPVYEAPGFEADDVIGTLAVLLKSDFNIIIASGDMDTLQLVDGKRVRVYTLRKGIQDTILYDEDTVIGRYGFRPGLIPDFKGFAGDSSDNIIGVPGIGEKTATALLMAFGSVERVYETLAAAPEAFAKAGIKERAVGLLREHQDEAEFSKVLATIRTDAPIHFTELKQSFRDAFHPEACVALFTELGFRSLIPRVQQLSALSNKQSEVRGKEVLKENPMPHAEDSMLYKESAVMLWLAQSETTNPTFDDVLNGTQSKTLAEAHEKLSMTMKKENLDRVYEEIERPLIPVIETLNRTGILIDGGYLKKLSLQYHQELDALAKKIFKAAGSEFNINSPKQLGEVLFVKMGIKTPGVRQKKTATGQISTKESELAKLQDEHPIVKEILAYRELQKLLSTYIDAIPPLLGNDKRLRTTFVQTGTTTGRLSSQNPNLQNIPVKSELGRNIRGAFIAPKGRVLVAFDYSQIELRLAALLSGDKKLADIFRRGEDVHAAVAAEVFGVSQKEVNYEMRRRAKVINFGILYGMGVNALRQSLGTDRIEAQNFLNRYFETYPELAGYLEKTKASASRLGYTATYFGRKRFFPGIRSRLPHLRAASERMAINAPLQGTQADIVKIAMAKINALFSENYSGKGALVLQIHDELIFELDAALMKDAAHRIKEIMETVIPESELNGIPLTVSVEYGPTWGDMEQLNISGG